MSRIRATLWVGTLSLAAVAPLWVSTPLPAVDAAVEKAEPAKPRGRLPNHFGKLGVSANQRQRIYEIQADYNGRIDDLLAQIEQLRTERNTEVEAVLTPDQQKKLADLREEQAARRKAKPAGDDK